MEPDVRPMRVSWSAAKEASEKNYRTSEGITAPSLNAGAYLDLERRSRDNSVDDPSGKALVIDFSRFHDMVAAPADCATCPYVPDQR